MTAINYLRTIEKEITEKANKNYQTEDGRRIHEITEKVLKEITTNNDNLTIRELNGEIIISTYHTYYQIFVKIVAGRGRQAKNKRNDRINEIWNNILNEINNAK